VYRFIQPDTLIPDLTNPQAWNRYSYVENRPIIFIDPTGQTSACGFTYSDPDCDSIGEQVSGQLTPEPSQLSQSLDADNQSESQTPTIPINPISDKNQDEDTNIPIVLKDQPFSYYPTSSNSEVCGNNGDGCIVAGALLILLTDLFIGLPLAYVIIVTGGATPPALTAEVLETIVVLPINLFGLYLISKGIQANKQ
jgi:hypothetical protein